MCVPGGPGSRRDATPDRPRPRTVVALGDLAPPTTVSCAPHSVLVDLLDVVHLAQLRTRPGDCRGRRSDRRTRRRTGCDPGSPRPFCPADARAPRTPPEISGRRAPPSSSSPNPVNSVAPRRRTPCRSSGPRGRPCGTCASSLARCRCSAISSRKPASSTSSPALAAISRVRSIGKPGVVQGERRRSRNRPTAAGFHSSTVVVEQLGSGTEGLRKAVSSPHRDVDRRRSVRPAPGTKAP